MILGPFGTLRNDDLAFDVRELRAELASAQRWETQKLWGFGLRVFSVYLDPM